MVKCCVILALALGLNGCTSPVPFQRGAQVEAPAGWIDYCVRNNSDISCGVKK